VIPPVTVEHLLVFGSVTVAAWFLFTYFWPRMLLSVFKRAILVKGFGDGPIPVNTLQAEPLALFADPLHPPASASKLATTGVNRDTLYVMGWLDLSKGSLVLHVRCGIQIRGTCRIASRCCVVGHTHSGGARRTRDPVAYSPSERPPSQNGPSNP
jgi:hypothetical protein